MSLEEIERRDILFKTTVLHHIAETTNLILFDINGTLVGLDGPFAAENPHFLRPVAPSLLQSIHTLYPTVRIGLLSSWDLGTIHHALSEGILKKVAEYLDMEHIYSGLQEIKYNVLRRIHEANPSWHILYFDDGKAGELAHDSNILGEYGINTPQIQIVYLTKEEGNLHL